MNRRSRPFERSNDDESPIHLNRRRVLALGVGVGTTLLAGCSGGSSGPGSDGSESSGSNFRLLVSDMPADIGDFDRLDVSFDSARVFEGESDESGEDADSTDSENGSDTENRTDTDDGTDSEEQDAPTGTESTDDETAEPDDGTDEPDDETNEPDGDPDSGSDARVERREGFSVIDLDGATVDLTQVVENDAMPVFEGELSEGRYQKIELHAAEIEGIVDGDQVEVMIPSGKLQITKPFEIRAGEATSFVFDINVVKRGNQASYNLKPVISESGVAGTDVEVEEVEPERARDEGGEETGTDGNGADDEGEPSPGDDEPSSGDDGTSSGDEDADGGTTESTPSS